MHCRDAQSCFADALTSAANDSLPDEAQTHLDSCALCRSEYEDLKAMWETMGAAADVTQDSATLEQRCAALMASAVTELPLRTPWRLRVDSRLRRSRWIQIAAAIALLGLGLFAEQRTGFLQRIMPLWPAQTPAGSVSGQVHWSDGTPAAGLRVAVATMDSQTPGASALLAIAESDTMGRYVIDSIPPGAYYLVAGRTDDPVYFPGTRSAADAVQVTITAGAQLKDRDFVVPGVLVTGRLIFGSLSLLNATVRLTSRSLEGHPTISAPVNAEGDFQLLGVGPGEYQGAVTGPNLGLQSFNVTVGEERIDGLEIRMPYSDPPVRVAGRLTDLDGLIAVQGLSVSLYGSGFFRLRTAVNSDGSFEFLKVPPGPYRLRTADVLGNLPDTPIVVGAEGLEGIELTLPHRRDVTGHLVWVDGVAPASAEAYIAGRRLSVGAWNREGYWYTDVKRDGSFRFANSLALREESYGIRVDNLPVGSRLQSIQYGSSDLTRDLLRVSLAAPASDLLITLASVDIDALPGVRVSGRVSSTGPFAGRVGLITLVSESAAFGPGVTTAETKINADGSFEFPKVPRGIYRLVVDSSSSATSGFLISVDNEPVSGLEIRAGGPPGASSSVRAEVLIEGDWDLLLDRSLRIRLDAVVQGSGFVGAISRPPFATSSDKKLAFYLPLKDGAYRVTVEGIPEGFRLKSIASGSLDLTKEVYQFDEKQPADVRIELEPIR